MLDTVVWRQEGRLAHKNPVPLRTGEAGENQGQTLLTQIHM